MGALLGHAPKAAKQLILAERELQEACLKQITDPQLCEAEREKTPTPASLCCCLMSSDCPPGDSVKYLSCWVNTGVACIRERAWSECPFHMPMSAEGQTYLTDSMPFHLPMLYADKSLSLLDEAQMTQL